MQGPKWDPLQRAVPKPHADPEIQSLLDADKPKEVWMNRLYQVVVYAVPKLPGYEDWPEFVHLCIKRIDKEPIRDWRHLQRIKNELVGPECEGVELYPAESRLVDTANQFHLFVMTGAGNRFPFGFNERVVSEGDAIGAKQRPFERGFRPKDCVTDTDESFKAKAKDALERKRLRDGK